MAEFLDKLRESLGRLTPRQRLQIVLAAAATLALVWSISIYATRVRYDVLFSGLEQEDAASVVAALREQNVPYRLDAAGRVIEVPQDQVDELRLRLAGEGLPPGGGVGFEIFDRPAFGVSDFVQNVNYRRALERELGRTIQSLGAVQSARVHLALPPESVFADERREPSASVVVRLRSGGSLSTSQVRAISHLVASGVEGLRAEQVSVIDGDGRMLSTGDAADEQALSVTQIESKRSMERNIESTLVSILEPVVGPGRVRARATVELNLTRVQRVEERFDPDVAVVRSEQKTKSRQAGGAPSGIPGTASNLPGAVAGAVTAGAPDESQSSVTNFELNKITATIAEPTGTLARQSVAVVVDHAPAAAAEGAQDGAPAPIPRSAEEMAKITDIVRAAIGLDEKRGDVLIVENVAFDEQAAPGAVADAGGFDRDLWLLVARYAALPVAVLLLALLVIRPGIAALRGLRGPLVAAEARAPLTVAQLQARLRAEGAAGSLGDLSPLRRKLIEAAREDPRAAALVVKSWLADEREARG
jgi:flagellar M-ring protein FliF